MFTITENNVASMRRVLAMAYESIFNGESVDSMTSTGELSSTRRDCLAFLTIVNEFQRNMEPMSVNAAEVDAVVERLNYVNEQLFTR